MIMTTGKYILENISDKNNYKHHNIITIKHNIILKQYRPPYFFTMLSLFNYFTDVQNVFKEVQNVLSFQIQILNSIRNLSLTTLVTDFETSKVTSQKIFNKIEVVNILRGSIYQPSILQNQ